MEMMLDKKQIQAILLFEFKMGHKAVETTRNVNNAFGPGTANEHTVQWWFKKFCKGDKSLEDRERSGQPSEVDNDQLIAIIKADPLTTTQDVAKELNVDHSMVIWHLKQIGKVCIVQYNQETSVLLLRVPTLCRYTRYQVSLRCPVWP
ncbi:histone-lysine N-methyltransferase SETMAR-like [Pongo abelii]|uniref:histone-lysine N-methyltransferase SETMAR-like n=1 Tax=Pongo abelii TaxID=9601 RepID=UPI003005BE07